MFGKNDVLPGRHLTLGITLTYVSLFLFIPSAAFILYASDMSFEKFFATVNDWRKVHAYGVIFFCALAAGLMYESAVFSVARIQFGNRLRSARDNLGDSVCDVSIYHARISSGHGKSRSL